MCPVSRDLSPLAVVAWLGGGLGHVDGLLERPLQVYDPFLYHLPDVLDPLLLRLNVGCLGRGEGAGTGGRDAKGGGRGKKEGHREGGIVGEAWKTMTIEVTWLSWA